MRGGSHHDRYVCLARLGWTLGAYLGLATPLVQGQLLPSTVNLAPRAQPATQPAADSMPALKDANETERATIDHLLTDSAWPRRAIGAVRLERYGCDESRAKLVQLLHDPAWQVRAFAIRALSQGN